MIFWHQIFLVRQGECEPRTLRRHDILIFCLNTQKDTKYMCIYVLKQTEQYQITRNNHTGTYFENWVGYPQFFFFFLQSFKFVFNKYSFPSYPTHNLVLWYHSRQNVLSHFLTYFNKLDIRKQSDVILEICLHF